MTVSYEGCRRDRIKKIILEAEARGEPYKLCELARANDIGANNFAMDVSYLRRRKVVPPPQFQILVHREGGNHLGGKGPSKTKMRKCLGGCAQQFESTWSGDRICRDCRMMPHRSAGRFSDGHGFGRIV